jgi:hypothetical protein
MRFLGSRRLAALVTATSVAAGLSGALASPSLASQSCGAGGTPGEMVCTWSGGVAISQGWTIPAGVTSVTFDVYGGSGGGFPTNPQGGHGAKVTATLAVTPGETLGIFQGIAGGQAGLQAGGGFGGGQGAGRFGAAGQSDGGGGFSAVKTGLNLVDPVLLLAGGGGGQGGGDPGGGAGGDAGPIAAAGTGVSGATGGGGGTASAGGAGGTSSQADSTGNLCGFGAQDGQDGSFLTDYNGGFGGTSDCAGGGGGGGGYYGGGGGGAFADPSTPFENGAGGGAGSSYVDPDDPNITNSSITTRTDMGDGEIVATFIVPPQPQSITFGPLGNMTYGAAAFAPSATASSGLPVSFTVAGNCSFDGTSVSITGAGSCTVTAHQAGNGAFLAAQDVAQSFNIAQAPLTIIAADKTTAYNAQIPPLTAAYSGFVNGDGPASLDTPVTLSTTATQGSAAGPYPITASGAADANYQIGYTPGTLTITPIGQTITFNAPSSGTVGGTFTPSPTASSGLLPVTVALDSSSTAGACTLTSGVVHFTGTGSCVLDANQPGNVNYTAAPQVQVTIGIGYTLGTFLSPLPKSTLAKSGATIPVKFTLRDSNGPLTSAAAAALAASGKVWATLNGSGSSGPIVVSQQCTWDAQHGNFQCNVTTPKGLMTGTAHPYFISAQTKTGTGTLVNAAGSGNPETVYFK